MAAKLEHVAISGTVDKNRDDIASAVEELERAAGISPLDHRAAIHVLGSDRVLALGALNTCHRQAASANGKVREAILAKHAHLEGVQSRRLVDTAGALVGAEEIHEIATALACANTRTRSNGGRRNVVGRALVAENAAGDAGSRTVPLSRRRSGRRNSLRASDDGKVAIEVQSINGVVARPSDISDGGGGNSTSVRSGESKRPAFCARLAEGLDERVQIIGAQPLPSLGIGGVVGRIVVALLQRKREGLLAECVGDEAANLSTGITTLGCETSIIPATGELEAKQYVYSDHLVGVAIGCGGIRDAAIGVAAAGFWYTACRARILATALLLTARLNVYAERCVCGRREVEVDVIAGRGVQVQGICLDCQKETTKHNKDTKALRHCL